MTRRADELNTTSFAMLGMLAIRPWSTYELAKHLDRSLRPLWPRARSNLFNEPKKLVVHGLAVAAEEAVGRRPRTVYTITPAGRRALREWLGTPGEGPVLEFEQLLKVFFSDQGSKTDALTAVATIKDWAHDRNAQNIAVARAYLAGTGPFPDRAAVLSVVGQFHTDFADMVSKWADWATTTIEAWPDDPSRAEPDLTFMKRLAERDPDR
ncbi:MAG TPA: PadR family transcriptional regulator [Kribbella sp.]|uniref:PadR family transcriptional regulator n=1 Tax=Kribbella sp. TaxID=1871183 RepID=UPI002D79B543|nr:PadR family transcriptional regulator [Kribbella sp.]HET6297503.1 PadR family transcriptional regulator [Kribbella sp.]